MLTVIHKNLCCLLRACGGLRGEMHSESGSMDGNGVGAVRVFNELFTEQCPDKAGLSRGVLADKVHTHAYHAGLVLATNDVLSHGSCIAINNNNAAAVTPATTPVATPAVAVATSAATPVATAAVTAATAAAA
eukprot:scpid107929/ scgid33212/ 